MLTLKTKDGVLPYEFALNQQTWSKRAKIILNFRIVLEVSEDFLISV